MKTKYKNLAVPLDKLRCTSTIKIRKHILYCVRFAVPLDNQHQTKPEYEN